MSVRVLNLGSLAMGGVAVGGLGVGLATDTAIVLFIAFASAAIFALLRSLAFSREVGGRFDAMLDQARRHPGPSGDDAGGR